jgi:antitoxin HicB
MEWMKHYTYTIEIHPAEPGETGYWVSVPALPGCFTQGDTYEDALVNAEEAIIGHLEALAKAGADTSGISGSIKAGHRRWT